MCAGVVLMLIFSAISVNGVQLYRDLDVTEHDLTNANSVIFADETRTSIETKSASKGTLEVATDGTVLVNTNGASTGWKEVEFSGTEGVTDSIDVKREEEGMGARLTYTDGLLKGVFEYEIGTILAEADPNVRFKAVPDDSSIDTLEWDLQSFTAVIDLQFTPFYAGETHITAAQYCRFLNAYKDRFSNKTSPRCAVTSVFNNEQGGEWVQTYSSPDFFITLGEGISWDSGSSTYTLDDSDANINKAQNYINWYGAVAYCQYLNDVEFGSDTTKWKYRLPTEWEWEFMAGAKTVASTSNGTQDWGNASWNYGMKDDTPTHTVDANNYMNYLGGVGDTVIVGNKGGPGRNAVNEFDCHEVSGQLWHWCLDCWGAAAGGVSGKDYVYKTGGVRVCRGGYWNNVCMISARAASNPDNGNFHIGFRVVRDR